MKYLEIRLTLHRPFAAKSGKQIELHVHVVIILSKSLDMFNLHN